VEAVSTVYLWCRSYADTKVSSNTNVQSTRTGTCGLISFHQPRQSTERISKMRAESYRLFQLPPLIEAAPLEHIVDAECNLPAGAHLIMPRRGYLHHGIYVGDGNVVHYSGSTRGLHRGPVEEIPLDRFTCGDTVWVLCRTPHHFDPREVIRRARSRVGENHYRVFSNNCEHFCEWCLHGEHRSYQVEALLSVPGRALKATLRLVASLVSSPKTMRIGTSPTGTREELSFKRGAVRRAGIQGHGLLPGVFSS